MRIKYFLILMSALAPHFQTTESSARSVPPPVFTPGFSVVVAVSPAAQAKLQATQENVILTVAYTADFNNGTDPQTIVERINVEVPVSSPPIKMKTFDLRPKVKFTGVFNGIEIGGFSSRHQSEYNVLNCSGNYFTPKHLPTLEGLTLGMYCKLIGE